MQVPIYQNHTPNPLNGEGFAHPAQNVHPVFDYERAMTKALQPLHEGIGLTVKIAEKQQAQQVKAQTDEALNALDEELRNLQWAPDTGYYSMQGKNAVDGYEPTRAAMRKAYQTHLDKLEDPYAKEAFESVAQEKLASYDRSMQKYRLRQNQTYKTEVSDARLKSLIQDFAFSNFSEDSERTMASIMQEVEYQAHLGGKGSEWVKQQKENYASLAYAGAYQQMVMSDPVSAIDHFQMHGKDRMSPEVARKTYAMLFENSASELHKIYSAVGGASGVALTSGAAGRFTGSNSRITLAQQGLGTPPKASDKVLSTSGYKGCNPLNIRAGSDKWQGAIGQTDKGYAIFSSPVEGIRAAAKIICTYSDKYGISTIGGIISRFAPASENPTRTYIHNVAKLTGFDPNECLDTKNPEVLQKLISAMINQEIGGNPYSEETLKLGIARGLGLPVDETVLKNVSRLEASDLALGQNAKTGNRIIDNLAPQYRARLDQMHRQESARLLQEQKIELKKSIENGLSLAMTQGDVSGVPDIGDFVSVYGQDEGLKLHKEVETQARINANMFAMPGMPFGEIQSISKSLMPQKDDPNYADRVEQKQSWDKAASKVLEKRAADPMAFAIQYVPDHELKPIQDWNQPLPNTLTEVARRVSQFESISSGFGLDPLQAKLFTNDEASRLTDTLGKMSAEQAAPLVSALATVAEERGGAGAARTLINQFSKDGKPTWISSALALATSENAVEKGYVKEYLAGRILLADKQTNPDAVKTVVNQDIEEELRGLFATPETARQASEIIKGIYAYRLTMGADRNSVEDIVEDVYGRNEEFNGGRVFMPRTTEFSMPSLMASFVKLNADDKTSVRFRGGTTSLGELTKLLPSARLVSLDEGKYLVKDGTDYVRYCRNGDPLILDFRQAVEKVNTDYSELVRNALDNDRFSNEDYEE